MLGSRQPASLSRQAPAKVNLFLRVLARRPDGFHELETVMARLERLQDTLLLEPLPPGQLELRLVAAGPAGLAVGDIPLTDENLVLKAARLLQPLASPAAAGVRITLVKRVPSAAGLGGGSSDAAAALAALHDYWSLDAGQNQLRALAAQLGSDVPFFLADSAWVLCTGRGEVLTPVSTSRRLPLVLARPAAGLSTPAVFRACTPEPHGPAAETFLKSLKTSNTSQSAQALHNSLQTPAVRLNSQVAELQRILQRENVVAHQMTGSGSAYFAICYSVRQACCIAARLRQLGVSWVQVSCTSA